MFDFGKRLALATLASVAVLASGCSGGASSVPAAPAAPTYSTNAAFQGSTTNTFSVSRAKSYHSEQPSAVLVSILQLDVDNGNASFKPYGSWDCFDVQRRDAVTRDDGGWGFGWGDGPIYAPSKDQRFPIPSFSMSNACANNDNYQRFTGNYYVLEVAFSDLGITFAPVAGPGAEDNKNVDFPAANAPLVMDKNTLYAFLLVATSGTLATPTPAPTATPAVANCPSNIGLASAPTSLKATPAPIETTAPNGAVIYSSLASSLPGNPGALACDNATGTIYGTVASGGYFGFNAKTNSAAAYTLAGASQPSRFIADASGELFLDNGATKAPQLLETAPGGTATPVSIPGLESIESLAAGSDGNAYAGANVGGTEEVLQITPAGVVTAFTPPSTCSTFTAETADASGNLYFADLGCGIVKMTTGGAFTTLAAISPSDSVKQMTVGPDGAVYYPSISNNGFVRVDASSGASTAYALPASIANQVLALAAGPDGKLWFSAETTSAAGPTGVIANWSLATQQLTAYPTSIAGTNDPGANENTAPISLIPGPSSSLYGSTQSAQANIAIVKP